MPRSEKKRILILSQYFWPESFRINDLASDLLAKGFAVEVLTAIPNYPEGRFFEGYGLFNNQDEGIPDGLKALKIHRVWIFSRGRNKGLRLVLNYLSFVMSASFYILFRLRGRYHCTIVFAVSPLLQAIPGVFFKIFKRVPLVIWIQDLWPETLSAVGVVKSARAIKVVGALVRWIYSHSKLLLIQSRAFQPKLLLWGASNDQIRYLPNWGDESKIDCSLETEELPEGFKIMFAGNLGRAQGLSALIEAANITRDQPEIKWIVIGDGSERLALENLVSEHGLGRTVIFLGRKPSATMPAYFEMANALLVTLSDDPVFTLTIPSKIQSYLQAGKPLIGALDGEGANLINDHGIGIAGAALNGEALAINAKALLALSAAEREAMGFRAKSLYGREFRRDQNVNKIVDWINHLDGSPQE